MRKNVFLILFTVVLNLIGCAPTRQATRDRAATAEEVMRRVHERDRVIQTVRGNGSITIETLQASNSGSFDLHLRKPDSLRVELSGPFGIRVGTLMLAREQFLFYNWRENTVSIGQPDGRTLSSLFHLTLRFDEILQAFTGEFMGGIAGDSLISFTAEEDGYTLRYRYLDGTKEYRVDPDVFIVTSYRLLDASGRPTLIALASHVDTDTIVPMPRLLRVILPVERRSLTIAYDDLSLSDPVRCDFTPPPQAEVIKR